MTSPILITAPTIPVLTAAEVKSLLGNVADEDNATIDSLVAAVTAQIDAASGGYLDRALRPQTWEYRLEEFPTDSDEIRLPFPPVTEVVSVKYDDVNGDEQALVLDTDYRVFGLGDLSPTGRQRVWPIYNGAWATARADVEPIRIRYTSGYAKTPNDLMPQAIKQAVALGVRKLLSLGKQDLFLSERVVEGVGSRRWTVSDQAGKAIKEAMDCLLFPYRVLV